MKSSNFDFFFYSLIQQAARKQKRKTKNLLKKKSGNFKFSCEPRNAKRNFGIGVDFEWILGEGCRKSTVWRRRNFGFQGLGFMVFGARFQFLSNGFQTSISISRNRSSNSVKIVRKHQHRVKFCNFRSKIVKFFFPKIRSPVLRRRLYPIMSKIGPRNVDEIISHFRLKKNEDFDEIERFWS